MKWDDGSDADDEDDDKVPYYEVFIKSQNLDSHSKFLYLLTH